MPMGGGKTVTTLTALDTLDMVEPVYPVLVLAPLRVARTTWPEEVEKWDHLRICASVSSPERRSNASAQWHERRIFTAPTTTI